MRSVGFFSMGIMAALLLTVLAGFMLPSGYRVRVEAISACPPEELFEVLEAPTRWKEWAVQEDEQTRWFAEGTPDGPGAVLRWEGDGHTGRMEVLSTEKNELVTLSLSAQDGAFESVLTFQLSALPEGGTQLSWIEEGSFGWKPLVRIYAALSGYEAKLTVQYQDALNKLAGRCEEQATP